MGNRTVKQEKVPEMRKPMYKSLGCMSGLALIFAGLLKAVYQGYVTAYELELILIGLGFLGVRRAIR